MARGIVGLIKSTVNTYIFKVRDYLNVERTMFDTDGYLYQLGTKLTPTALAINGITAMYSNQGVSTIDGSTGQKACRVNGLTIVTGGTGIADLTLAAPTEGARAVIRIGTLSSGNVVVTCATGVTLNGTNKIATFDAANEALSLIYKAANTWEIESNVGAVAISGT